MGPVLIELRVRNLGVIDDVAVTLEPGMTALTGETGAGKTLLVDALSLLLGGRPDPSMVRTGTDEAMVEGRFALLTPGDGPPTETVLARSVARRGRSRAWIDGRMATVAALGEAASALIELHGQHQHRSLVHTEAQRQALDDYGDIDLAPLQAASARLRTLVDESVSLGGDPDQRARQLDLLRYQADEIGRAGIEDPGEDQRLETEEDRLAAAGAHRQAAAVALSAITGPDVGGAIDQLAEASRALHDRLPLAPIEERIRSSMADLSDVATELRSVVETWDDDPVRLEEVRIRRQLLHELQRKYGGSLDEVLAFGRDVRAQAAAIEHLEQRAVALDKEIHAVASGIATLEADVAAARRQAAPRLATAVESTLQGLAMPSARFAISVEGDGPADQVTFLLGANVGEALQPLAKAASGGELARTMLAVRLALSGTPGVVAFDEVDAGVGGAAATAVGTALAGLGAHAQVLVVTHLAQVAALADHQIAVRKTEREGRTRSEVIGLDREGRVVELSRMLSGRPDSASARRHARELLDGSVDPAATTSA